MEILRKIALTFALLMSVAAAQSYPIITAGGGIQEWQTATNYVTDDIVWESEDFYKALTVHTSGVFATDFTNNEWIRMSDDLDKIGASNDNAIVRWDGVLGEAVQNSGIIVDDLDNIHSVNSLTVGGVSPSASSSLDVFSTTQGTRPWPSMTTAQRDAITAPATSLAIYNTDTDKVNVFNGTIWKSVGSGIDAWQASFDYVVGDVVYNGTDAAREIYVANGTFTSGGAFVPGNWTELAQHVNRLPFGTATATALVKWADTDGDNILNTGILVDASNNITGAGDISMSSNIEYRDSPLLIHSDDLDGADLGFATIAGGGTSGTDRGGSLSVLGNDQALGGSVQVVLGDVATADFSVSDSSGDIALNVDTLGVGSLPLLTASKPLQLNASNEIVAGDIDANDITGILPITNGGTGNSSFTGDRVIVSDSTGTSLTASANLLYDGNLFEVTTPDGSIPMTKMNQASRLALTPVNGITVYDTDDEKPYYYDGANWKPIGSLAVSSANLAVADYSELQIPLDQITVTDTTAGLEKVRIETGNDSFLTNGSFEHETYTTGWTTSGSATYTLESSDVWEGSKSVSVSASGGTQNFELFQSKTLTQYEGNTLGFTCMVKSDSAKVKLCTENGTDEKDCVYHDGNGMWKKMQAIMMVDSTGVMVGSVKNDTNEDASIVVDSCEWSNDPLKIKTGLADTDWKDVGPINITAVTTSPTKGTTTSDNVRWRRVGDSMEVIMDYRQTTVGVAGSGVYLFEIPEGYAIDTSKVKVSTTITGDESDDVSYLGSGEVHLLTAWSGKLNVFGYDSTNVYFKMGLQGDYSSTNLNALSGNPISGADQDLASGGISYFVKFTVPIQGWSARDGNILTASDIVSSETMAFQFKGSGDGALDCNTDPVGTYTTYDKAGSTNTFSQCASAPTTIPTNLDGFKTYSTSFTGSTGCTTQIARHDICVGKGLRGVNIFGYEGLAKSSNDIRMDKVSVGANSFGIDKFYNQSTGMLSINAGLADTGANTSREWMRTTGTPYTGDAYLHFHASKNPVVNAMETIPIVDYSWENEFSARIANNGTATIVSQNTPFIESVSRTSAGKVLITFKAGFFTQPPAITVTPNRADAYSYGTTRDITTSSFTAQTHFHYQGVVFNPYDDSFSITVSRQGSDYKERGSTAAIIAQPTCFIKDIKSNGTQGGNSASNTFITRDLNTLQGQCDGISISSNTITINTGDNATWILEAKSPCRGTDDTSLHWRRDPAGANTIDFSGMSTHCENNSFHNDNVANMDGTFQTDSGSTEFELDMFTTTFNAVGTQSLGRAVPNDGVPETYSVLKLIRIK